MTFNVKLSAPRKFVAGPLFHCPFYMSLSITMTTPRKRAMQERLQNG